MKPISLIQSLYRAFYSRAFYAQVIATWRGRGFLLLLVLLGIVWVPAMIQFDRRVMGRFQAEALVIADQLPDIRIKAGEVQVDAPMPIEIFDEETRERLVVIDTSGEIASVEDAGAPVLLTRDKLIFKNNRNETRVYDLSKVESFELSRDRATTWIRAARKVMTPLLYPFAVGVSYAWRVIQALLYAVLAWGISRIGKKRVPFAALIQLALVALIPSIVFGTVRSALGFQFPFQGFVGMAIVVGYLGFGLRQVRSSHPEQQVDRTRSDNK